MDTSKIAESSSASGLLFELGEIAPEAYDAIPRDVMRALCERIERAMRAEVALSQLCAQAEHAAEALRR